MDGRRYCYYLTPTMLTPEGYLPVVVVGGCAGYGPPSGQPHANPALWSRDLPTARQRVDEANTRLGISAEQARQIAVAACAAAFAN
jgi:hypothetical protein